MISADASKDIIRYTDDKNIEKQDLKSIKFEQEQYNYKNNPDLDIKISELKETIDNLNLDSKKIKELLLEIAKKMEELRIFNTDEICRKIKEFLHDEINQKKISERLIEKCLPRKYVRRYEKKTEVYSVQLGNQIYEEHKPFSHINFLYFKVDEKSYIPKYGTIRNKFSKFLKQKKIELCYRSKITFYTLPGIKFGKIN